MTPSADESLDRSDAQVEGTPRKPRVEWIDVVKGLAISLVVYGHVMQGSVFGGVVAPGGLTAFTDTFIYSFHMPAFFFISGLLSARALKGNLGAYISDKACTIAWPYLVWTILNEAAYWSFAGFYQHQRDATWHHLLTCLWDPAGFWFLHTLFCVQVFAALKIWIRIEALFALSLIGFFFAGSAGFPAVSSFLFFLPFFLAGIMSTGFILPFSEKVGPWGLAYATGILVFQAAFIAWSPSHRIFWSLLLGFTGTFGLITLAVGTRGTFFSRAFARVGAASLGVFLLHPYLQGLTRSLLHRVPGTESWSIAIQIVAAIVISMFLYEFAMGNKLRGLFTLKPVRRWPESSPNIPTRVPYNCVGTGI